MPMKLTEELACVIKSKSQLWSRTCYLFVFVYKEKCKNIAFKLLLLHHRIEKRLHFSLGKLRVSHANNGLKVFACEDVIRLFDVAKLLEYVDKSTCFFGAAADTEIIPSEVTLEIT